MEEIQFFAIKESFSFFPAKTLRRKIQSQREKWRRKLERVFLERESLKPALMAEGSKGERKESSQEEEDSVKLFVGQVPKHMTEAQLLAMFQEFALVDEVNIIRDKATRASRGSFSFWFQLQPVLFCSYFA